MCRSLYLLPNQCEPPFIYSLAGTVGLYYYWALDVERKVVIEYCWLPRSLRLVVVLVTRETRAFHLSPSHRIFIFNGRYTPFFSLFRHDPSSAELEGPAFLLFLQDEGTALMEKPDSDCTVKTVNLHDGLFLVSSPSPDIRTTRSFF